MNQRHNSQPARQGPPPPPGSDVLKAIIIDGDPEITVKVAKDVGRTLKDWNLTTSQIRNFFGAVREIEMRWTDVAVGNNTEDSKRWNLEARRQFLLLKPKLAYYVGKDRGRSREALQYLESVLSPAIDLAKDKRTHFGHFVDFFEAILAYHKFYGGSD